MAAASGVPSAWIVQWAGLVSPGTTVLDIAAGSGRHSYLFVGRGHHVTAVDLDTTALMPQSGFEIICADLEKGGPWPLPGRTFGAVVVTNYLHRPLMPRLLDAVAPGGVLLYETFMKGNERFGRPDRPAFLLEDGELLELVRGRFSVTAYEARMISEPRTAMVQRIAARRL